MPWAAAMLQDAPQHTSSVPDASQTQTWAANHRQGTHQAPKNARTLLGEAAMNPKDLEHLGTEVKPRQAAFAENAPFQFGGAQDDFVPPAPPDKRRQVAAVSQISPGAVMGQAHAVPAPVGQAALAQAPLMLGAPALAPAATRQGNVFQAPHPHQPPRLPAFVQQANEFRLPPAANSSPSSNTGECRSCFPSATDPVSILYLAFSVLQFLLLLFCTSLHG